MNKLEKASSVLLWAGLGCFLLSFVAMGLAPWTTLEHVLQPIREKWSNPYYDKQGTLTPIGQGRQTYIHEGCWHCHSQFVRPVSGETNRYGPVSQSWESMYDIPQTFGTRRVGPDLSRESGRHPNDWHEAHLYNPRFTVPESIMPSYPWLFQEGKDTKKVPTQQAKNLIAYLQFLGKPFKKEIQAIIYPKTFKITHAPQPNEENIKRGRTLYLQNCQGCHGSYGEGNGPGASFLTPAPSDLSKRSLSPEKAYEILSQGVLGSAMPSFREMLEKDLWALSFYVSALGEETKKQVLKTPIPVSMVEKGKSLFQSRCSVCHGTLGNGQGPAAKGLHPKPKDLTKRLFQKKYFFFLVQKGVPKTAMPPAPGLSKKDLEALYSYTKSLYKE